MDKPEGCGSEAKENNFVLHEYELVDCNYREKRRTDPSVVSFLRDDGGAKARSMF